MSIYFNKLFKMISLIVFQSSWYFKVRWSTILDIELLKLLFKFLFKDDISTYKYSSYDEKNKDDCINVISMIEVLLWKCWNIIFGEKRNIIVHYILIALSVLSNYVFIEYMVTYERHNIRILLAFHDLYVSKATHNFMSNNSKDLIFVS